MKAHGRKIVIAFVGLFLLTYICLLKVPPLGIGMALGILAVCVIVLGAAAACFIAEVVGKAIEPLTRAGRSSPS